MRNYATLWGIFWGIVLALGAQPAFSQTTGAAAGKMDERLFIESKWRYTYTLHAESNTTIHKADDRYDYYLYFRYDFTYQEFFNDKLTRGNWSLDGRTLFYTFQHVNKFEIVQLNKSVMVLEFQQKNSKGTYQYHFVRVDSKQAPFPKPDNELPEVIVEAENPLANAPQGQEKRKWWQFFKKKEKETPAPKPQPTYISVDLIGGGYYGGIDPVIKDFIQIKTDGRLIKEFQSQNQGLLVTKKNISRDELEMFAEYAMKQGFFDFERTYDCTDARCSKRKGDKPTPIPLRIAITYGQQKKVVTVAIWGKDERNTRYVDYPPALDNIIDAVQRMANRLENPVVRK